MATWFDEARLDDPGVLETVHLRLRTLAESGARVLGIVLNRAHIKRHAYYYGHYYGHYYGRYPQEPGPQKVAHIKDRAAR